MREIKFRAWNGKKMFNVDVLAISPCTWDCPDHGKRGVSLAYQPSIKVMQYTGLKDKNVKEIYEGDIARKDNVIYEVLWVESSAKFGVKVTVTDYVLSRGLTFPIQQYVVDGTLQCNLEVIGNIYENPDLIKKAE